MKLITFYIFVLVGFSPWVFGQPNFDNTLTKILSGNDDYTLILDLLQQNKSLTDDSLYKLLEVSDDNYLRADKKRKAQPDLQFRQIGFSDQLFRAKCYFLQIFDYSVVQKNDIELQTSFLKLVQQHPDLSLLTNSEYLNTFSMLLIHSVTTLEEGFFVNNFYKFSKSFADNFKEYDDLRLILDLYLNFRYKKQYFDTEYGKSKLCDGAFGLLPKIADTDFKNVLGDLKIKNAIY
jgi:hypothetical protein